MIRLIAMMDADFAWLAGDAHRADLIQTPGGIMPAELVPMLRSVSASVGEDVSHPVAWMIADDDEVVGMVSFTKRLDDDRFELGYGVAPSREGRGYTTAAVRLLIDKAHLLGLAGLTAETSTANPASRRVVEANGFRHTGGRDDPEDGPVDGWALELKPR